MTKKRQMEILLKCVGMLARAKVWGNPGATYLWNLVKMAHRNGWLYVGFDGESIDVCMIVYRVNEVTPESLATLPDKEEGDTLYVLVAVSEAKDKTKLAKMKRYILEQNPEVRKVALHHRWDENRLRIYGVNHGKTIKA